MTEHGSAAAMLANQPFGLGMTVGVVVGFALGTFVALWVGEGVLDSAQRLINQITGGDDQIHFELLQQ